MTTERETEAPTSEPSYMRAFAWSKRYGRWILLVFGVSAVVGLVVHVGPDKLWATLAEAAPWLPIIFALEAGWIAVDGCALLSFYGDHRRKIPTLVWVRVLLVHYMTMALLPVGRTGAEITRAAMLTPYLGSQRAAAGAAQQQSSVLFANALICIPCLIAITGVIGFAAPLSLLLAANCIATGFAGVGLYLVTRNMPIGGFLGRRFRKMAKWGPELDQVLRESPRVPWKPLLICLTGRAMQTVQYGFILLAVGGGLSVTGALISEGIHLVGAGLGDIVPNQVGVTESAYRIFADALDLGGAPEKALAIALVARLANFTVAGSCILVLQVWRPTQSPPRAESQIACEQHKASLEIGDAGNTVRLDRFPAEDEPREAYNV